MGNHDDNALLACDELDELDDFELDDEMYEEEPLVLIGVDDDLDGQDDAAKVLEQDNAPRTFDQIVDDIVGHLELNHANQLPMCACLDVCRTEMPHRDAEGRLDEMPVMRLSLQNAHALIDILIDAQAIERIDVPEPEYAQGEEKPDQPVDYLLRTTAEGEAALERYEPSKRFAELLSAEPDIYGQAYALVLACCENGAKLADIEYALRGNDALVAPKQVYPQYFVSKLETVGGLSWDGAWCITEAGRRMLASVG